MSENTPTMPKQPGLPYIERIVPGRFEGRTVIVTGAGSGIGRACALRVAKEGGKVVAADVSKERIDALVAENPGLGLIGAVGDIAKESGAQAIVDAAGGPVDGLINNAGIMDEFQPAHEVTDAIWDRVFDVNVKGMLRLMRLVIPGMLERGHGSIVNVSSEAGLRGSCAGAAYTASKHAVIGLTKNSSVMYWGKGLRVNAVAPGAVMTGIVANFSSALGAERLGPLMQAVVPTPARPEQLAATITFLLSEDATNISGAVVASDGGWSAI